MMQARLIKNKIIPPMRIVYMGTPEFAIAPLEELLRNNFTVSAVVTAPDKPAGRGKQLHSPAVKIYAQEKQLRVLQPLKLKDPDFITGLKEINPDLIIVVAFRMLPKEVWSLPKYGTFNLHASLLPQYRGAAPINHAIINGEKETGLTTFFIDEEIDTGKIIFQEKLSIGPNENAGALHDRMMTAGAELVVKTVHAILNGTAQSVPQEKYILRDTELKSAPKIQKEDCRINWNHDAPAIHNLIRGLSPFPGAFSELQIPGQEKVLIKIFSTEVAEGTSNGIPGSIQTDHKTFIKVNTRKGLVKILELQLAGKKRMDTESFLRGYTFASQSVLC
jgi:methionyl-tRNA formyltransferase